MSRICKACVHPDREANDQGLVANDASNRMVATQYSLSEAGVRRHREKHLPEILVRAQDAAEITRGDTLLEQLVTLCTKANAILTAPENQRTALAAVREVRSTLELIGKVSGELANRHEVDVKVYGRFVIGSGYGEPEEPTVVEGEVVG